MTTEARDAREWLTQAREGIARLRDEVRVRVHLAGLEAKQAWEGLETQLGRAQTRLEQAARSAEQGLHDGPAGLEVHLAVMEARDRLRELAPALQAIRARIERAGEQGAAQVPDALKLEAQLAKMDLADAVERRRAEAERGMREIRTRLRALADEIGKLVESARPGSGGS